MDLNESEDDEPSTATKSNGKARKPAKQPIVEEDDEDEDEQDLEDEELDGESEDEFAVDRAGQVGGDSDDDKEMDASDDEDEEDENDEDPSEAELPSDLSDDEDQSDTLNGLDTFVDQLNAADQKKRQTKNVKAEVAKTKRRVLPVSSGPTGHGTASGESHHSWSPA